MDSTPDSAMIEKPKNGRKPKAKAVAQPKMIWHPYRCLHCGRLLFEAVLIAGCRVRVRCPKCGHILSITPLMVKLELEPLT